jgi:hypothetical protein
MLASPKFDIAPTRKVAWMGAEHPEIKAADKSPVDLVRHNARDGLEIPAFLAPHIPPAKQPQAAGSGRWCQPSPADPGVRHPLVARPAPPHQQAADPLVGRVGDPCPGQTQA